MGDCFVAALVITQAALLVYHYTIHELPWWVLFLPLEVALCTLVAFVVVVMVMVALC